MIRPGNGLCPVCHRGFEEDDDLSLHVIAHPGRSPVEIERAREIIARRDAEYATLAIALETR